MEVREIIKKTRHKAELPLKYIVIAATVIGMFIVGVYAKALNSDSAMKAEFMKSFEGQDAKTVATVEALLSFGLGCSIVAVIFLAILILFQYYKMYAQIMSYSVKVTETNFPEIYNLFADQVLILLNERYKVILKYWYTNGGSKWSYRE